MPWLFKHKETKPVLSLRSIVVENQPCLVVARDKVDGMWRFLRSYRWSESDFHPSTLGERIKADETLSELADLEPGWCAERTDVGKPWYRKQLTEELWPPYDTKWRIKWPEEEEERQLIARRLFGYALAQNLDYWYRIAEEFLKTPEEKTQLNECRNEDERISNQELSTLTASQRAAVMKLIAKSMSGCLFSTMDHFDEPDNGRYRIMLVDKHKGENIQVKLLPHSMGFHEAYHDWIGYFSQCMGD